MVGFSSFLVRIFVVLVGILRFGEDRVCFVVFCGFKASSGLFFGFFEFRL